MKNDVSVSTKDNGLSRLTIAGTALALLLGTAACTVEKTRDGSMPEVDVDADAGQLPEVEIKNGRLPDVDVDVDGEFRLPRFDIDGPDINVGTREVTVTVPKPIIVMEEETVTVPYVDVDMPGGDDAPERRERTLTVELETPSPGYGVQIQEIYGVGGELWVLSELKQTGASATKTKDGKKYRISDRIVMKTPDYDVRHFIVGAQPISTFNDQYRFIASKDAIKNRLAKGRLLYSRSGSAVQVGHLSGTNR